MTNLLLTYPYHIIEKKNLMKKQVSLKLIYQHLTH